MWESSAVLDGSTHLFGMVAVRHVMVVWGLLHLTTEAQSITLHEVFARKSRSALLAEHFSVCVLQVIASKGPQHMTRGRQLLQAFQNPNRSLAAAATAASNAAGEPGRKAGAF